MQAVKGATNYSAYFYVTEDVGGTSPGEPKTGMAFGDLTSASYMRQGAARVSITPITLATPATAHSDGGFVEVDATNMKGLYRLDLPDLAIASGVDLVVAAILPAGAQNAVASPLSIDLVNDIAATAIVSAGAITTSSGAVSTVTNTGTVTGNVGGSVGSVTGAVASVTAGVTLAAGAVTNASLAGNMEIVFETDFATNYNVTRNAWVTNFTDILGTYNAQTGDSFALADGASGFVATKAIVDAIKVPTDKMVFTKTNELDVNTKSINDAEVIGDGNATPWDGV